MGVGGQRHAPVALPPGKTQYPLYRRLGGPVWTGAENLAHTGIRSPDRPDRSTLLYRLSYPSPIVMPYIFRTHFHYFRHTYVSSIRFSQNTAYATINNQQSISSSILSPQQYLRVRMTSTKFLQYPIFSITNLLNNEGQRIRRDHVNTKRPCYFFSTALKVVYYWVLV
jgi:hypothetical protein